VQRLPRPGSIEMPSHDFDPCFKYQVHTEYKCTPLVLVCVCLFLRPSSETDFSGILTMLIQLTVGKVDAGVAVLLTEDKRLVGSLPSSRVAMGDRM
jgi:hypothetical protein